MIISRSDLRTYIDQGIIRRPDGSPVVLDIASVGLHLGRSFLRYVDAQGPRPLPFPADTEEVEITNEGVSFPPGACILAASVEKIQMPLELMGFVQTKGTIARGFVTVHLCDGQIDPGFEGNITLELVNFSKFTYQLYPGMPIAQLFLQRLSSPAEKGYSGRYQFAQGPTSMRVEVSPKK